jgi:hypothetical protein
MKEPEERSGSEEQLPVIMLTNEMVVERGQGFITMPMDEELACIEEKTGNYFGLNTTGQLIWELLETPLTVEEIINSLLETFPEESHTIPQEIPDFLASLASLQLITIRPNFTVRASCRHAIKAHQVNFVNYNK